MAVNLKTFKFETSTFAGSTEDYNWEVVAPLKSIPDFKGKKLTFTKGNLRKVEAGLKKRIALQIFPTKYQDLAEAAEAGKVQILVLSEPLSKQCIALLKKGSSQLQVMKKLLDCEVNVNTETKRQLLMSPASGDGELFEAFEIAEIEEAASIEDAF